MERWDVLGFLIITLNSNVTMVGKMWLILMILLRMAVLVLAGYPIYQDEQERFVCNTLQPGCSNVCYDIFSPVSHLRFWLIQSVSVLLPYVVFSVYVLHRGVTHIRTGPSPPDSCKGGDSLMGPRAPTSPRSHCLTPGSVDIPDFSSAYTLQLILRTLLEVAFSPGQYYLFGFLVPEQFSCYRSPCTSMVDCYISRPTEKSILVLFMWGVSGLSFVLSVVDLAWALQRKVVRKSLARLGTAPSHALDTINQSQLLPGPHREWAAAPVERNTLYLEGMSSQASENPGWPQPRQEVTIQSTTGLNIPGDKSSVLGSVDDGSEVISCVSERPGLSRRQSRAQHVKEAAFSLQLDEKSQLGRGSSAASSRLEGQHPLGGRKSSEGQLLCSSPSYLRSKKSEWV
ncbi:gap junction delta-4 protein [Ornithorhynchus anatinus]|uniref:Gap junction protein n=1 Tax=Ornithorhynchus anatinus TaxID=9258 RepID=A0A6I8N1Y1_ORNAN|nr:gap junction delta-4 protein [Ornithorhynchus anatinus]